MKTLDHSKIYYKGLGQATEEECTRCLRRFTFFSVVSMVLLLITGITVCLGINDRALSVIDLLVAGFSAGTFFWLLMDDYPTINKFRLRLKEIEEGEEE